MDSILQKLKKIKTLVEQGKGGEVEAAKEALYRMLEKHHLTIEDLEREQRSTREFTAKGEEERYIFLHCILNFFGRGEISESVTYYKNSHIVMADMTDLEAIEFKSFFEFHLENFRREKKSMLKTILPAYLDKHRLFAENTEPQEIDEEEFDFDELRRILFMAASMEKKGFYKQLES